jgi:L-asparaginase
MSRPVRLLAAGGTIAMQGVRAVPALDAEQLIEQLPDLETEIQAESILSLPSAQLSLNHALELAQRAAAAAHGGEGVVLTTGTDTMEELAVLCSFLHDGDAPIVLTGANRPASGAGADGPANLLDALTVAGSVHATGLGTVVVFGGEIHAGMSVRKVDSTGPAAFGSPVTGSLGRVVEGRVWRHATPARPGALAPASLSHRVDIVTAGLGDKGALLAAAAQDADGLVVVALGAGHVPPGMADELRRAAGRLPVVLTCRPERSSMLFATYGFEGAEEDLRSSAAVCAPFLSAAAARVALLSCLGAGLDRDGVARALAPWDAQPG